MFGSKFNQFAGQLWKRKFYLRQTRDSRVILTKMVMFNETTDNNELKLFRGLRLLFGRNTDENRTKQTIKALKQVNSKIVWDLLEEPSFPQNCWSDLEIRLFLASLALLDANNVDSIIINLLQLAH